MTARDHDRFADDVGAYVLGALEPAEADAFASHLENCEECREEVVRLGVARDALPRAVEQVAPPAELKASLMETVRAEAAAAAPAPARAEPGRSRSRPGRLRDLLFARPAFAAAAAAVLVAIGIGLGALVGATGGGDSESSRTVAAKVDQARMPAGAASLVLPDEGSSGAAILNVEGMQQPQAGHVYEVWIMRGGQVTPSTLFTVKSDGSGSAGIPEELRGADAVLVTREPAGGSKTPSEPAVLTVPLSS